MKKLLTLLVFVPVAIILVVLSVANRHPVVFNFDPINPEQPFLAISLPFFVYLFAAVLCGMIIGSMATWFTQGKYRKMAREQKRDALKWETEAQTQKEIAKSAINASVAASPSAPASQKLTIRDNAA